VSGPSSAAALAEVLDPAAVTVWIESLEIGAVPPLAFSPIGLGLSNLTFAVTDAEGRRWVLRRPPAGELLESAHDVAREYRILAGLGRTDVPAPAVYGLCTDQAISPVPLALVEMIDGLVIEGTEVGEELTPEVRGAVGHRAVSTLARIHAIDLEAAGLAGLSRSKTPHARRLLRRWHGQWEASKRRELPAVDDLAERLAAAEPPQVAPVLVHGDYHLLNLIVGPRDGEIRAVLDWELATLGDPLSDVGALLAYWPEREDPGEPFTPAPLLPGFPSRDELVEGYAEASRRPVDRLPFWHALGLWKVAIISEGVLRRAEESGGADSDSAMPPGIVENLVEQAEAVARRAGI
jgi:aminoglycoside phosphotransferase (APT) family kinase protein